MNDTNDQKPEAPEDPQRLDASRVNPPAPEDEASVVWLVSYSEEDDRELYAPQIAEALRRGEIDAETIVWREGAEDWVPLEDVPELAKLLPSSGETAAAPLVAANAGLLKRRSVPPPLPGQAAIKAMGPMIGERAVPTAKGTTKLGMPAIDLEKDRKADATPLPKGGMEPMPPPAATAPGALAVGPDMPPTVPKSPAAPNTPTTSRADTPKAGTFASYEEEAPISIDPESLGPPNPAPARAMQRAKALSPGTLGMKKPAPPPRPPMKSTPDPEPPKQEPPKQEPPVQAAPQRVKKAPPSPPRKAQPEAPKAAAPEPALTPDPGTPSLGTLAAPARVEPKPAEPKRADDGMLSAEELLARAVALDPATPGAEPSASSTADTSPPPAVEATPIPKAEKREEAPPKPTESSAASASAARTDNATEARVSEARPSAAAKAASKSSSSWPIFAAVGAVALIAVLFGRGNPDSEAKQSNPETPPAAEPKVVEPAAAAPAEPAAATPATMEPLAPAMTAESPPAAPARADPTGAIAPAAPVAKPAAPAMAAAAVKQEIPAPKESKPVAAAPPPGNVTAPKAESKPPATEQKEVAVGGDFDTAAAAAALAGAAQEASGCRKEGDPSGVAMVRVTFSNAGRATRATIEGPPFAGTQTGGCIASTLRKATVPPYGGERVTVSKKVVIH